MLATHVLGIFFRIAYALGYEKGVNQRGRSFGFASSLIVFAGAVAAVGAIYASLLIAEQIAMIEESF